jgi:glycosyltransferase involved in cell wall biosynthesis
VNSKPLVSVVIPTYNRPALLLRAIDSALHSVPNDDVEVIVVPNGPSISWREIAERCAKDARVQWQPIHAAQGNVARNHGMNLAAGKYLRFLDDDDYLLPAAADQTALLESTGADVCSGRIENVDEDDVAHGLLSFPQTDDFVCAAVSFSGFALPTGHLFLRTQLENSRWDVTLGRRQDYAWMLDLAANREWRWVHMNRPVGAWFQHRGIRISHEKFMEEHEQPVVDKLFALHHKLGDDNRLNAARSTAIATALWHHIHLGFPHHPRYWSGIARRAQSICPTAQPPHPFFTTGFMGLIDPVVGEWALLPFRKAAKVVRSFVATKNDTAHMRRL